MDVATVSALLTSLKNSKDLLEAVSSWAKTLKEIEMKGKLAELDMKFSDSLRLAAQLQSELAMREMDITSKNKELEDLRRKLEWREQLEYRDPFLYEKRDTELKTPFCSHCYDVNGLRVRVQFSNTPRLRCSHCKNAFVNNSYSEKPSKKTRGSKSNWLNPRGR